LGKPIAGLAEDTTPIRYPIEYVSERDRELTDDNGAPILEAQSQAVNFILGEPELSAAIAERDRTPSLTR
jgi:hypothetical protein